jgi:flagellar basal-body rod protein FlgB
MDRFASSLMIKALDGLSTRAVVTAQNIANANSPGYRPMRVTFEQALLQAAKNGPVAVNAIHPQIEADPEDALRPDGRIDLELSTGATTASRYAALVEILNRRLQIDGLAITGGR